MHIASLRFGLGILLATGALAIAGCGNSDPGGEGEDGTDTPQDVVFTPGQGQQSASRLAYPGGAKGIGVGSIIENFRLMGYANAMVDTSDTKTIELAEFYNPTGTGVFEEGSVFPVGSPKPVALALSIASVWCGPCNYEADQILPGLYVQYKPRGGEFMVQLADSATPGEPATLKNLDNWTGKYDVDYPATLDPSYKLGALFEADAFPANIIIDTRTMEIVESMNGAAEPGDPYWKKFESLLNP